MNFDQIERAARQNEQMPDDLQIAEQSAFTALRALYNDYRKGNIGREAAGREKTGIKTAYEMAMEQERLTAKLLSEQQNRIRRSEDLTSAIMRDIRDGASVENLYVKCLKCIGELVGNEVIVKAAKEMEGDCDEMQA